MSCIVQGSRGGILQHYTIRCDHCGHVKDWVFLMGGGWRKCVDCYEEEHGPQPAARKEIEEFTDYKTMTEAERESKQFWSEING